MTATTTTERPILFTPAMAQAVFDGRKTQTRRLVKRVKLHPDHGEPNWNKAWVDGTSGPEQYLRVQYGEEDTMAGGTVQRHFCPYGSPGDRLFVREAVWLHPDPRAFANEDGNVTDNEGRRRLVGWSGAMDADTVRIAREYGCRQRPNIHMPRWACRSVLEIARVRVERVQDISEEDALAEGFEGRTVAATLNGKPGNYIVGSAREAFFETFYDINKRAPRDANPWVWVIEFTRLAAIVRQERIGAAQ